MKDTVDYELQRPVKYSNEDGVFVEASFLLLQEPDYRNPEKYIKLKEFVEKAQLKFITQQKDMIGEDKIDEIQENAKSESLGHVGDTTKSNEYHKIKEDETLEEILEMEQPLKWGLALAGDTFEFIKTFKKMALEAQLRKAIIVDNKIAITEPIWNSMHPEDQLCCALRWAVFFVFASVGQRKRLSENHTEQHTQVKEL